MALYDTLESGLRIRRMIALTNVIARYSTKHEDAPFLRTRRLAESCPDSQWPERQLWCGEDREECWEDLDVLEYTSPGNT